MVLTNDVSSWKDFPKGISVLLLDEDTASALDMKSKLENMDYVVSMFLNVNEALSAVLGKPESFHVAIVEVTCSNNDERFKFLEIAKDLPTVMTSKFHCLSTMMKCIALGAVEFLKKPLSEDKLRNIWQHVVHKAFNSGNSSVLDSLKPVKHSVTSMLKLGDGNNNPDGEKQEDQICDTEHAESVAPSTPSTPQLEHVKLPFHDGDTNCSSEKENGEQEGESKFVESTCGNEGVVNEVRAVELIVKNEQDSVEAAKEADATLQVHKSESNNNRSNKKKIKVDWTPDLHSKFVQAVDQLGVDQAIPSRILELMKVEGLTRHNVASHLQKYRMHKRNILPKHEERRWQEHRDQIQRSYYSQRPIMAYPTYHHGHSYGPSQVYHHPLWGVSTCHQLSPAPWAPSSFPSMPAESWTWTSFQGADAWGCPVMRPALDAQSSTHNVLQDFKVFAVEQHSNYSLDGRNLEEEASIVDEAVNEAINKPWLPLPLGLKPPCTEIVLAELSRKGISAVPPPHDHRLS